MIALILLIQFICIQKTSTQQINLNNLDIIHIFIIMKEMK
jgi:hypothetical protein